MFTTNTTPWYILALFLGYCANTCNAIANLPDALSAVNRRDIAEGGALAPVTLKFVNASWVSSKLSSHAVCITLQEQLGLNVEFAPGIFVGRSAWMQVADYDSTNPDITCFQGPSGSIAHLGFEIWKSYTVGMKEEPEAEAKGRGPYIAGTADTLGTGAFYIRREVINKSAGREK